MQKFRAQVHECCTDPPFPIRLSKVIRFVLRNIAKDVSKDTDSVLHIVKLSLPPKKNIFSRSSVMQSIHCNKQTEVVGVNHRESIPVCISDFQLTAVKLIWVAKNRERSGNLDSVKLLSAETVMLCLNYMLHIYALVAVYLVLNFRKLICKFGINIYRIFLKTKYFTF